MRRHKNETRPSSVRQAGDVINSVDVCRKLFDQYDLDATMVPEDVALIFPTEFGKWLADTFGVTIKALQWSAKYMKMKTESLGDALTDIPLRRQHEPHEE